MDPREFQFVFGGFTAAWLIVVVYVVSIASRERKLRKELDRVRQMVEGSGSARSFTQLFMWPSAPHKAISNERPKSAACVPRLKSRKLSNLAPLSEHGQFRKARLFSKSGG